MKINGYMVLHDSELIRLTRKVNEALKNGWVPQGGVAVRQGVSGFAYYQAMVSEAK